MPVLLVFSLLLITYFSIYFSLSEGLSHYFGVDNTVKALASCLHMDNCHIMSPTRGSPEMLIFISHFRL